MLKRFAIAAAAAGLIALSMVSSANAFYVPEPQFCKQMATPKLAAACYQTYIYDIQNGIPVSP